MKAIKNLFFGTEPLTDSEILISASILGTIGATILITFLEIIF